MRFAVTCFFVALAGSALAQSPTPAPAFENRPMPSKSQRVLKFSNANSMAQINTLIRGRYDGEIVADIARPGRFLFRYGGVFRVNPDGSQTQVSEFVQDISVGDCLRAVDEDPGEIGDLEVIPAAEC